VSSWVIDFEVWELWGQKMSITSKEPFRFDNPCQQRIYEQLLPIGEAIAACYLDACKMASPECNLDGKTLLISHALREIEGMLIESIIDWGTKEEIDKSKSKEKRVEKMKACLKLLEVEDSDPLVTLWSALKLHKVAHRESLLRFRPKTAEFDKLMADFDDVLEAILQRYTNLYPTFLTRADAIIAKDLLTKPDLSVIRHNIPSTIIFGYFFTRQTNPNFLRPLQKAGFFSQPIFYEAQWLRGVADKVSSNDADLLADTIIQSTTDNSFIIQYLIQAALKLPVDLSWRVAEKKFGAWMNVQHANHLTRNFFEWINNVQDNGRPDHASNLTKQFLDLVPVETSYKRMALPHWHKGDSPSNIEWYYVEAIKHLPITIDALTLPSDLLQKAIRIEKEKGETRNEDNSHLWRPAIEDHPQNYDFPHILVALVVAVRDNAIHLLEEQKLSMHDLLAHFEAYKFPIYKRLILFLLRQHPTDLDEVVADYLGTKRFFSDPHYRYEYYWLLHDHFSGLPKAIKERYFKWVDQGPENLGNSEEDLKNLGRWQREKLHPIKDHLPADWLQRYSDLIRSNGPPDHPDFYSYHESSWGPKSPVDVNDLGNRSVAEVLEYLRNWRPSGREQDPSPLGLARILEQDVAKRPAEYTTWITDFKSLKPIYSGHLFDGLREACKNNIPFDWQSVIVFGQWIMDQPKGADQPNVWEDRDVGWGYCWAAIATLIRCGCQKRENTTIPFSLRNLVWRCLEPIMDDPDPNEEREARHDRDDFNDVAINSTRGKALEAIIAYVFWCAREMRGDGQSDNFLIEVPEAKKILEKHLDIAQDPSFAIHSLYGFYIPFIWYRDQKWAVDKIERIFPLDEDHVRYRKAAWLGYINYHPQYLALFDILRKVYEKVIDELDPGVEKDDSHAATNVALQLVRLHLQGKIAMDDPLLVKLYQGANKALRMQILSHVGHMASTEREIWPDDIKTRAMTFMDWRLNEAQKNIDSPTDRSELYEFGWWFTSKQFDVDWSLSHLLTVLGLTGGWIADDDTVVRQLNELTSSRPRETLDCLHLMVAGGHDEWIHTGQREIGRALLRSGLSHPDPKIQKIARDTINLLLARNHWDFRELL
jgi:hypothetical protein